MSVKVKFLHLGLVVLSHLLLLGSRPVSANDSIASVGIGGITMDKTEAVSMVSEKLTIQIDRIDIHYTFMNRSNKDVSATVAFPLPPYEPCSDGQYEVGSCQNEMGDLKFTVKLNGKPLPAPKSVEQIVVDDTMTDKSAILTRFGLPRYTRDVDVKKILSLSPEKQRELEKEGLIGWMRWVSKIFWTETSKIGSSGKPEPRYAFAGKDVTDLLNSMSYVCKSQPECTGWVNMLSEENKQKLADLKMIEITPRKSEDLRLKWKAQRIYSWNVTFPANQKVEVDHSYEPIVGSSSSGGDAGMLKILKDNPDFERPDYLKEVCIDPETEAAIYKLEKRKLPTGYHRVDYILKSAKSWNGPIEDFTLTVKKPHPTDSVISTCFKGLKKISAGVFQATVKNFVPNSNLSIHFYGVLGKSATKDKGSP